MAVPKSEWIKRSADQEVQPKETGDSAEHKRRVQRVEDRMRLITISDQVAGETLYTRSFKWDLGNKFFPDDIDAHMRFVTKYYPYTRSDDPTKPGAPLYVDEPQNERQVKEAYQKQAILHKMGIKHIVVESRRTNSDTGEIKEGSTLDDCLMQLEHANHRKRVKRD